MPPLVVCIEAATIEHDAPHERASCFLLRVGPGHALDHPPGRACTEWTTIASAFTGIVPCITTSTPFRCLPRGLAWLGDSLAAAALVTCVQEEETNSVCTSSLTEGDVGPAPAAWAGTAALLWLHHQHCARRSAAATPDPVGTTQAHLLHRGWLALESCTV